MSTPLTVYLLKDFIENTLDLSGSIISSVFDGTNTVLTVCDIFHLREDLGGLFDGVTPFVVLSVDQDLNTFTVLGDQTAALVFSVANPFYFWGTPLQANTELSNTAPAAKYPFAYLKEIIKERNFDQFASLVRESDVRIFFLDEMNKQDWHTVEMYSNVLIGLNKLVDAFITQLRNDQRFFSQLTTFERVNHSDFGLKIVTNKGHIEPLFADNLSGVELSFTLSVRSCCACEC